MFDFILSLLIEYWRLTNVSTQSLTFFVFHAHSLFFYYLILSSSLSKCNLSAKQNANGVSCIVSAKVRLTENCLLLFSIMMDFERTWSIIISLIHFIQSSWGFYDYFNPIKIIINRENKMAAYTLLV